MSYLRFLYKVYFLTFCYNFLISKYYILNIFLVSKIQYIFIVFNFYTNFAIWKKKFSSIFLFIIFIIYFFFEKVSKSLLKIRITRGKNLILFKEMRFFFSNKERIISLFLKFIYCYYTKFVINLKILRSKKRPYLLKMGFDSFFDLLKYSYMFYLKLIYKRCLELVQITCFFVFRRKNSIISKDILRLYNFKI